MKLILEKTCSKCGGTGKITPNTDVYNAVLLAKGFPEMRINVKLSDETCPKCEGTCKQLTPEGDMFLSFCKRHFQEIMEEGETYYAGVETESPDYDPNDNETPAD